MAREEKGQSVGTGRGEHANPTLSCAARCMCMWVQGSSGMPPRKNELGSPLVSFLSQHYGSLDRRVPTQKSGEEYELSYIKTPPPFFLS